MIPETRVLITTKIGSELVDLLRERHHEVDFVYPETLLPEPTYPGDHRFPDAPDGPVAEQWWSLLSKADVLLNFGPARYHRQLAHLPQLEWIQAMSSGIGQFVRRVGLDRAERPLLTTARGVHGRALAEFAVMSLIYFNRDLPEIIRDQRAHRWYRRCGRLLAGQRVCIVGMGSVGAAAANAFRAFDAEIIGIGRQAHIGQDGPRSAEAVTPVSELDQVLPTVDALVMAVPHTDETDGMVSAHRISLLPERAVFINLARGSVVDEQALALALASGRLRGAALDVVAHEPLSADSPLWDLPNVLLTPHSMSTVEGENERIVEIFSTNLERFRGGRSLQNLFDPTRLY